MKEAIQIEKKICILVVSHNNPELTDSLCEDIIKNTRDVSYDLHVIETGSEIEKISKYTTLWVKEKCRMTRGFNILKKYADYVNSYINNNKKYDAYCLFVNDAKYINEQDLVGTLYKQMLEDDMIGVIHPYQINYNLDRFHGNLGNKKEQGKREESFFEFICPLIKAEAWDKCGENLLDNSFYYGWGLDYDIPAQMFSNGYKICISDTVGIYHNPFTSYRDKHITKEKMNVEEFKKQARSNMEVNLIKKYGFNWKKVLLDKVPSNVNRETLYNWLKINDSYIEQ